MRIARIKCSNFDERTLPVSLIVLHYTGMESGEAARERLQDEESKVSAHYIVNEDGGILQLVNEHARAWHAGVSEWRGETNINSASIGIEIVNGGHDFPTSDGSLPAFPAKQIDAVIALIKDIYARNGELELVGHSDIAPARKQDPGEHFPWKALSKEGLGFVPEVERDCRVLFEAQSRDRGIAIIQNGLSQIGYSARVSGVLDEHTQLIIAALQRRYRQDQIDGQIDMETMAIIKALVEHNRLTIDV